MGGTERTPARCGLANRWTTGCGFSSHAEALCEEYTIRFGKTHYGESQIEHLWSAFVWQEYMTKSGMTEFARALNQSQGRNLDLLDEDMDPVDAYRTFYLREKARFAKWDRAPQGPPRGGPSRPARR